MSTGRSVLLLLLALCMSAGVATAQRGNINRWERRELRADRHEIRADSRDLRGDRRELLNHIPSVARERSQPFPE